MKKKTERDAIDESPGAAAPRKAAPRTRLQEAMRRRHTLGLIRDTQHTGQTNELIEYLRMIAGKATYARSLTAGPPWSSRDLQPDKYVEVPQELLLLIADILSGKVTASYDKKRKRVDKLRPGALREMKAELERNIRIGHNDKKVHAEIMLRLKNAGWPRKYPEDRSDIAAAVKLILANDWGLIGHPGALAERLKKTPRTPKTGKSATGFPTEILRKKKATL